MTPVNLLIVLSSTLIHVLANLSFKRARQPRPFVWGMLALASLLFSPLLLAAGGVTPLGLGVLALSGLLDALYFYTMSQAYTLTDLSIAYPLARGTSPLLLVLWSLLFLGEKPTLAGLGGIVLIVTGMYVVNLKSGDWLRPLRMAREPGPRRALLAGLFISLYSALDKYGIQRAGVPPLTYTYFTVLFTVFWLTPPLLWRAYRWRDVRAEWRAGPVWMLVGGAATLGAYSLVLLALQRGTPVLYAGAVREFSVVVGAFVGWRFLKEEQGPLRVLGAALVAAGVATIALGG